jgi:hypothetical protein
MEENPVKCIKIKASGAIRRVTDQRARNLVFDEPENYSYCPKSEWKAAKKAGLAK